MLGLAPVDSCLSFHWLNLTNFGIAIPICVLVFCSPTPIIAHIELAVVLKNYLVANLPSAIVNDVVIDKLISFSKINKLTVSHLHCFSPVLVVYFLPFA